MGIILNGVHSSKTNIFISLVDIKNVVIDKMRISRVVPNICAVEIDILEALRKRLKQDR